MQYDQGQFVEKLCDCLGLSTSPRLIRSNTNLIYDCGDDILRLTPASFRSREEVERELNWLQFVGSRTDDVVQLIADGPDLTTQFSCEGEDFTVARFERIDGKLIENDQWNTNHFERLGTLTGFLHRVGHEYSPPAGLELLEWDRIPEAKLARHLPDDDRQLPQLHATVIEQMAAMRRGQATYGPIHYDIHHGNYLMTPEGRLVLLDFESSCRGHYINDVAIVLYYASLHELSGDDNFNEEFLTSFWRGYETEHPVPEGEICHIPWLLLYRSLMVYSFLLQLWPADRNSEQESHVTRVARSVAAARSLIGQ